MGYQLGVTVLVDDVDLDIRQGSDCTWAIVYSEHDAAGAVTPLTATGWTARSQIRDRVGGEVWLTQTVTVTAATGGKLQVGSTIAAATTTGEAWNLRTDGVWDLELVRPDGTVIPLAAGAVHVTPDVTRIP